MNLRRVAVSLSCLVVLASCGGTDDSSSNRGNRNAALSPATTLGISTDRSKVTLCHATASKTNPYQVITVDVNAAYKKGHLDHRGGIFDGKSSGWGDIIPPFVVMSSGKELPRDGLNWPEGKSIFENGCSIKRLDDSDDDVVTGSTSTSSTLPNEFTIDEEESTTTTTVKVSTSTTEPSSPASSTPSDDDKPAPTTTAASGGDFELASTTTVADSVDDVATTVPTKSTIPDLDPPTDTDPDPAPRDLPVDPQIGELVITPEQVNSLTGGNGTLRVSIDGGEFIEVGPGGATLDISSADKVTFSVVPTGGGSERFVAYRIVRPAAAGDDSSATPFVIGGLALLGLLALFLVLAKKRKKAETPA